MMEWMKGIEAVIGPDQDWKALLLGAMTPVFLIVFAIEWQIMRGRGRRDQFEIKDILASLGLGGSYSLFELLAHALITGAAAMWFWEHRLFTIPITWWTLPLMLVAVEFSYYWFHRSSHRVRWFWSAHVVHHSGRYMNLSTAMRQSLLYSVTGWWLFFMPLVLLGVHPAVVFLLYGVDLAYQFFVHTEAVGKLPRWYEYLFVTPSGHRVHHGRNPEYIDKNFGGILIIFDRLFGTWEPEVAKVDYGIPKQILSYNILTLNFHEFRDMWRDVARPGPLWQRLKHLWAPPEWERTPR